MDTTTKDYLNQAIDKIENALATLNPNAGERVSLSDIQDRLLDIIAMGK